MSDEFVIEAQARSDMGKGASRRLRREGLVPAVLYGAGKEAVALTVGHSELLKQLSHEAFFSHILTVKVNGKSEKAVLKDMQRHPAKPIVLHLDLMRVSAKEKLRMTVPLHFVNEDTCPGVKAGGVLTHNLTELEVSCLPKDLPEFIEVDLAGLQLNGALHLSDLKLPKGVESVQLSHGADHDLPVVSVHLAKGAVEATEEAAGE